MSSSSLEAQCCINLQEKITPKFHYENLPIQIYWKFYSRKMKKIRQKILIFFILLLKTKIVDTR